MWRRGRGERRNQTAQPTNDRESNKREAALQGVYREFDIDGGGNVGFEEMLILGQTRRKLGQKQGEWTKEMNRSLMDRIGPDANDDLPETNFVRYFNGSLPSEAAEFDKNIEQFLECARALRKKKLEARRLAAKEGAKKTLPTKQATQRQEDAFFKKSSSQEVSTSANNRTVSS